MSARPARLRASMSGGGRHRRPTTAIRTTTLRTTALRTTTLRTARAGATLVGATAVAAGLFAVPASAATPAGTSQEFAALRQCESGGNYGINTGNGYYGAYQFDLSTWRAVGGSGRPDQNSPAVQDQVARRLQAQRGWSPWPACSRRLGLGTSRWAHPAPAAAPVLPPAPAPAVATVAPADRSATTDPGTPVSDEVVALQRRLRAAGVDIAVDGLMGPQTRLAVRAFQSAHGLVADGVPGTLTHRALFR